MMFGTLYICISVCVCACVALVWGDRQFEAFHFPKKTAEWLLPSCSLSVWGPAFRAWDDLVQHGRFAFRGASLDGFTAVSPLEDCKVAGLVYIDLCRTQGCVDIDFLVVPSFYYVCVRAGWFYHVVPMQWLEHLEHGFGREWSNPIVPLGKWSTQ